MLSSTTMLMLGHGHRVSAYHAQPNDRLLYKIGSVEDEMCDGNCNKCWRSDLCDQDYVSDYAEVENTDSLSAEAMSHCQNDQDVEEPACFEINDCSKCEIRACPEWCG